MISKAVDGYYHPRNEADACELVKHAAQQGLKIRVRGSGHSINSAIYTGNFIAPPPSDPNINLYLDRMVGVCFDNEKQQVTVEAGCHLGKDPADPTRTSTIENSLFYQIDRKGWAFPDTGGITYQTVGGFLSTGSSGGSLRYSVADQIVGFRVIDGTGSIQEFHKSEDLNDPFYALGVSMGLLGIITAVTFQCVDRFDISGTETTSTLKNCKVDLFGAGDSRKPGLESYLRSVDYSRVLWFPQKGVNKVVVWEAKRASQTDTKYPPYREFPTIFGSELPAQIAASYLFRLFDLLNPPEPTSIIGRALKPVLKLIFPPVINTFLTSSILGPQRFSDAWWEGIPMDNRVNYDWLPTTFTELWLPISKTPEIMQELHYLYQEGGYDATTSYACEFYATSSNNFWMSPAYQRDSFRVDPFWFAMNRGDPAQVYYPKYWDRLRKFNYRLHWGKSLVKDVEYLRKQYPRWDDFMKLRARMDPHQVFVTDYWREHLGIESN